jgi:hypothetical protein
MLEILIVLMTIFFGYHVFAIFKPFLSRMFVKAVVFTVGSPFLAMVGLFVALTVSFIGAIIIFS